MGTCTRSDFLLPDPVQGDGNRLTARSKQLPMRLARRHSSCAKVIAVSVLKHAVVVEERGTRSHGCTAGERGIRGYCAETFAARQREGSVASGGVSPISSWRAAGVVPGAVANDEAALSSAALVDVEVAGADERRG